MAMPDGMERVIVHMREAQAYRGRSLTSALLEFLLYSQVQGATVTREGAGVRPEIETAKGVILRPLPEYPVQMEFVECAGKVQALLPRLREIAASALIEVQPVTVVYGRNRPPLPHSNSNWNVRACTALTIWVGEADRWRNTPLHEALVESMRAHGIGGATVLRSLAGYAGSCHGRPLHIMAVESPERVRAWLPVLAAMAPQATVFLNDAEELRSSAPEERAQDAA